MSLDSYINLYQFAVFVLMIPFTFKVLEALNIDTLFRRSQLWQKQAFYLIMTIVLSYLFSEAVRFLLEVFIQ
jgi:uncharacterized membrane protein YwzB